MYKALQIAKETIVVQHEFNYLPTTQWLQLHFRNNFHSIWTSNGPFSAKMYYMLKGRDSPYLTFVCGGGHTPVS